MQLILELHAPQLCLPLAYRHYIQSMIYNTLRQDPGYSAGLHDSASRFKLFTFGQLEGAYSIRDKQIFFKDRVSLEIRSVHDDLLLRLFYAFSQGSTVRLGSSLLTVSGVRLENSRILTDTLTVVTRSPIVAYITEESGQTRFFSPKEAQFYTLVTTNAQRKWAAVYPEKATDFHFSITPASTSFRKQVTCFKTTRITAWDGSFRLEGDPALLDLLYHTGLGAKSSQGFGMFSIAPK